MMHTGFDLRPYFIPRTLNASYWFLAISYFNVLPSFLPTSGDISAIMWRRARLVKEQVNQLLKTSWRYLEVAK